MDDEQLIECVRNYEFIYNLQHPKYMDNIKKEVAWKQIADEMKQSAVACKQKWQCLRDSYRRALNKKKETSRQAGRKMKKWKYEDEMSFLAPFLSQRKILDSVELTSDDDDPNETCAENPRSRTDELAVIGNAKDVVNTENAVRANATPKRTVKRLKTPQLTSAILMAKLLDQQNTFSPQKERDELDNFFLNISATVKKFPPYQQALAKNKIFSVVSKMELQHFAPPSTLQYEFSPSPQSVSSIAPSAVESPDNWNEFEHQQYTNMEINMDSINKGWFSEINDMWDGICLSLQIENVLHTEKSKYQDLMVVQTTNHGKALILDGIIQCTEYDEFSYQEMISFLPLCCHPNPKSVLIVGGGDGGVAREVAKHAPVEHIDMVEIDDRVVEISKQYLPTMAEGFKSPKLHLHIENGIEFVKKCKAKYDVIITDSSDPIGPATCLFQKEYFTLLKEALNPGGIICCQAGSIWCSLETSTKSYQICKEVFPVAGYARFSVPTYPSGEIGVVLASANPDSDLTKPICVFNEEQLEKMKLRFYNDKVHYASFILPQFVMSHFK